MEHIIIWIFLVSLTSSHDPLPAELSNNNIEKFKFPTKFRAGHPMLFFSRDEIPTFISKSETTHASHFANLQQSVRKLVANKTPPETYAEFAGAWNEWYGNVLPPAALYCLLRPGDTDTFEYLVDFMDHMVYKYDNWRTTENLKDEVPLGHNVAGFATALDFIFDRLDEGRKESYVQKLLNQTKDLYLSAELRGWGTKTHIQNHVATNVIGIFIGALVLESHTKEAATWQRYAITHWEKTMDLLQLVVDGSLEEGVGYGGYTFRSMCQYLFLVYRHYGFSHFDHPWLRKHFDFYYYTVVPGLTASIGIADAPIGWFYGPEASLYFLDAHVLRNGSGNWLGRQINKQKRLWPSRLLGMSQQYTMLHLDFIFYDDELGERPPPDYNQPKLHYFKDWGVVTYRGGSIVDPSQTYLSFKCSKVHGRAMYNLVHDHKFPDISWSNFNPGHEHPDQNSFTFLPNGKMFITEGLYGPKFPYLDNVHMFFPSRPADLTPCTPHWAGQMGTCEKWLRYKQAPHMHAHFLYTGERDGFVVAMGDSAHAYDSELKLSSVFRGLVLLEKDALVVVDRILLKPGSHLTHYSAFFNNHEVNFTSYEDPRTKLHGLQANFGGSIYKSVWVSRDGTSDAATVKPISGKSIREPFISNANVTFPLQGDSSTFAYLFVGPAYESINVEFVSSVDESSFVSVKVDLGKNVYTVSLDASLSKEKNITKTETVAKITSNEKNLIFTPEKAMDYKRRKTVTHSLNTRQLAIEIFLILVVPLTLYSLFKNYFLKVGLQRSLRPNKTLGTVIIVVILVGLTYQLLYLPNMHNRP